MAIQSVTSPTTQQPQTTATAAKNTTLGKDDFLKLLITQLRNQDPLNPLDQNQFLAQTAQFTTLEKFQNMETDLEDLKKLQQTSTFSQAASLLGKTATSAGNDVRLTSAGAAIPFAVESPGTVQIDIVDAQNTVVRQLRTDRLPTGEQTALWDGRDAQGNFLSEGSYHYRVQSTDGGSVYAVRGAVTGMTPTSNGVVYNIGDAVVRADDFITVG
jgi:flagellar basal-body rod modification protein FlgD